MERLDVVIVGAGVAGLTVGRSVSNRGQSVAILEKSRGLGGRLATRRLPGTHADHGVCYLKPKGEAFGQLIAEAVEAGALRVWTEEIHSLVDGHLVANPTQAYSSPQGITALAKWMARGLRVELGQRTVGVGYQGDHWRIETDQGLVLEARQLVLAIPPAQAADLLETCGVCAELIATLRGVEFAPSIAAIATYPADKTPPHWQGINCFGDELLGWIGLESSKQDSPVQPVVVVQSNAAFATQHLNTEGLDTEGWDIVGRELLDRAAQVTHLPWLKTPELLQVHRWRYAFATKPLVERYLAPGNGLFICGDWCGGDRVESAFLSGMAVAIKNPPIV